MLGPIATGVRHDTHGASTDGGHGGRGRGRRHGGGADPALGVGRARARRDGPLRPGPRCPGCAAASTTSTTPARSSPGTSTPPSARAAAAPLPHASGPRTADDVHRQIKGFTSTGAAAPGEAIDFHITVDPPQQFCVDIYRIGHYGGDGAAKITTSPRLSGIVQPPPLTADRTVSCHHWWLSWRLQIPVVLERRRVRRRPHHRRRLPLPHPLHGPRRPPGRPAARPARTSPGRRTTSTRRTAAPAPASTTPGTRRAGCSARRTPPTTVSFDRPYAGAGLPLHVGHAYDFIRWAERYGYDLAYADARDLHAGRVDPTRYRGLVFPGHDEYWSAPMRRTVELARDHGTSLVFLSANTMYWQVELGPSPSGVPDRLLTCRKRRGPGRPALWREIDRPEQQLLGIQYAGRVPEPHPLVVRNADHWLWEATGAARGRRARRPGRGRGRPLLPAHRAPRARGAGSCSPTPRTTDSEGATPPPGDLPLPGPVRRPGLRVRHLRLVPGPGPPRPRRHPRPARHRQPPRPHLQTRLTADAPPARTAPTARPAGRPVPTPPYGRIGAHS